MTVPRFLMALIMVYVLVFHFNVSEINNFFSSRYGGAPWSWAKFVDLLKHVWPVIAIAVFGGLAYNMRVMRGNLLDTLNAQYVETARAKGLSESQVIMRHAVPNALHPLIMYQGVALPYMLTGEIEVAIIFGLADRRTGHRRLHAGGRRLCHRDLHDGARRDADRRQHHRRHAAWRWSIRACAWVEGTEMSLTAEQLPIATEPSHHEHLTPPARAEIGRDRAAQDWSRRKLSGAGLAPAEALLDRHAGPCPGRRLLLMAVFADFLSPVDPKATDIAFAPPQTISFRDKDGNFSFAPRSYQYPRDATNSIRSPSSRSSVRTMTTRNCSASSSRERPTACLGMIPADRHFFGAIDGSAGASARHRQVRPRRALAHLLRLAHLA